MQCWMLLGATSIVWNSPVLTKAASPYLDYSYVTAAAEATQVYKYYCSKCPIWSMTERSKVPV